MTALVQAVDLKSFPLADHFHEAADWMENIIRTGGVVFVHCVQVQKIEDHRSTVNNFLHYLQGISRSATLVLAYLILKKNMRLQEAITSVKRHRSIAPNEGFMLQLIELNDDVHKLLKQSSIQK